MINEFADLVELRKLPKKRSELAYYIVGFTDGEGCFSIALKQQAGTRFGFVLDPVFHVTQHAKNRGLLLLLERFFGCGRVIQKPGQAETLQYYVDNRRQISEKIIPFFEKHALIVKGEDFRKFADIVRALENKEHSDKGTFKKLVSVAFSMNMEGKQRRYDLESVLKAIEDGSSETIRQTPGNG